MILEESRSLRGDFVTEIKEVTRSIKDFFHFNFIDSLSDSADKYYLYHLYRRRNFENIAKIFILLYAYLFLGKYFLLTVLLLFALLAFYDVLELQSINAREVRNLQKLKNRKADMVFYFSTTFFAGVSFVAMSAWLVVLLLVYAYRSIELECKIEIFRLN